MAARLLNFGLFVFLLIAFLLANCELTPYEDVKQFQSLLKTTPSILAIVTSSDSIPKELRTLMLDVQSDNQGVAEIISINCGVAKKLCKKFKLSAGKQPSIIHFHDGKLFKTYDRKLRKRSFRHYLANPTSDDLPWEEEDSGNSVRHIQSVEEMSKIVKASKKPVIGLFYVPWCGYCKRFKPEFGAIAKDMSKDYVFVGVDLQSPANSGIHQILNISSYPHVFQFHNDRQLHYAGGWTADELKAWIHDPTAEPAKPKEKEQEPAWSETSTNILHLTDDNFNDMMAAQLSALVMFYAPWCGHCKRMKPEFQAAANELADAGEHVLVAVDATIAPKTAKQFNVKGYPTIKYFQSGELHSDAGSAREKESILKFLENPDEPPTQEPEETFWDNEFVLQLDELDESSGEAELSKALKKKKIALVMFYAPWCGHCKRAKPEFSAAAMSFSGNPRIAFAAVDCTVANTVCNQAGVTGFPTMKMYRYGKIPAESYEGARMKTDFEQYVEKALSKQEL